MFLNYKKNCVEILNKLKSRGFHTASLSTYDFSTLYTILQNNLIKEKLFDLIGRKVKREGSLYHDVIIEILSSRPKNITGTHYGLAKSSHVSKRQSLQYSYH